MRLPKSVNKLEDSLDFQVELLSYYLSDSPEGSQLLREFSQNNEKLKHIIEEAALERKIAHARFLNKIRGLGFLLEGNFSFFQRIWISILFIFKKIDQNHAVPIKNKSKNQVE